MFTEKLEKVSWRDRFGQFGQQLFIQASKPHNCSTQLQVSSRRDCAHLDLLLGVVHALRDDRHDLRQVRCQLGRRAARQLSQQLQ